MANILDSLGGIGNMGRDALIEVLAQIIDTLGKGTDWTGEQIEKLGELEQQFADLVRMAKAAKGE